jgi:hypothetical protein
MDSRAHDCRQIARLLGHWPESIAGFSTPSKVPP